jgi:protein tyrosine/serine phosphatase
MSIKVKIYAVTGSVILLIAIISIMLALYGNVFRKPYPPLGKTICWIFGRPESGYNFGVVEEGHLYRSSQPDDKFMRFLNNNYKVTRVISLCGGDLPYDETAKELDIDLHTFAWSPAAPPDTNDIERVFALMSDPNHIVLVHCGAGADRTGYAVARYRILKQEWSLERARNEMRRFWYGSQVLHKLLEQEFSKG